MSRPPLIPNLPPNVGPNPPSSLPSSPCISAGAVSSALKLNSKPVRMHTRGGGDACWDMRAEGQTVYLQTTPDTASPLDPHRTRAKNVADTVRRLRSYVGAATCIVRKSRTRVRGRVMVPGTVASNFRWSGLVSGEIVAYKSILCSQRRAAAVAAVLGRSEPRAKHIGGEALIRYRTM